MAIHTFPDPGAGDVDTRENTYMFGRRAGNVTGGTYLKTAGEVSSDPAASPPVIQAAGTIEAATAGVDGAPGSTWEIEIQVNGVTVETISDVGGVNDVIVDKTLSAAVLAGNRLSVRTKPGTAGVRDPVVVVAIGR